MRVLILGGAGMLGHKLWQVCSRRFDAFATIRDDFVAVANYNIFDETRTLAGIRADDFESVSRALSTIKPDVVVNCIGIVKQDAAAKDPISSVTVNSLFPHLLARKTNELQARLIHLSTDCVFSGRKGNYSEVDLTDPQDLYGKSKLLGEVAVDDCLTIRTSMIGRELRGSHGLLEWFLSQEAKHVKGFKHAIFTGFTTNALAMTIGDIIEQQRNLAGLWHVAADPISKFDLLQLIKQTYGLNVEIEPDENFTCDRSLDGRRFVEVTGIRSPGWPEMIAEMHADPTPYNSIRRNKVA
jgi:dTDP-4-dehydrorhamnose reductase